MPRRSTSTRRRPVSCIRRICARRSVNGCRGCGGGRCVTGWPRSNSYHPRYCGSSPRAVDNGMRGTVIAVDPTEKHARAPLRRRPTPTPPRSTTSTDARSLPAAPANSATSERRWSACRARCAAVTTRTSPRIASMSSATVAPPTSSPLTPAPPAPRRGADSAERALQRQRLKLAEGEIAAAAERERNLASSIPDHTAWEAERGPLRQRAGELEAQLSGDLPDKPRARRTWQHAATRIEAYRFDHAVIDIRNALGPPPSDTQGRALATRPPRPPTRSARPRPP